MDEELKNKRAVHVDETTGGPSKQIDRLISGETIKASKRVSTQKERSLNNGA